ncbi:Tfp pilus assembly protein PilF [Thioclava sp. ES.031]|uniref:sulfotransferase n=1 Tax=Thioclava sp. ES.031 TaxID=1798203 RepID=UPI000C002166|nr:sulfotransferase [Thioclava sp. ES.031]PFG62810.1 Tfp pilus assembly protein PilF [Thioclava sp. ES.031]
MAGPIDKTLRAAKAHAKNGAFAEAEALYREVLARFPGNKRAQAGLAEISQSRATRPMNPPRPVINQLFGLKKSGRDREAAEAAARVLKEFPRAPAAMEVRAAALSALGDHAGAAVLYRELVGMFPDAPDAHGSYGNELMALFRDDEAVTEFERVLELRPGDPVALNNIGNAKRRAGEQSEALDMYRAALEAAPDFVEAQLNLANALVVNRKSQEAERHLSEVLAKLPDNFRALTTMGDVRRDLGDKPGAIDYYKRALAIDPEHAEALASLINATRISEGDPVIGRLEASLEAPHHSDRERVRFEFALGKAYEDIGETEKSFAFYARGNARRKKLLGYTIEQDETLFAQIKQAFPAAPDKITEAPQSGPEPIFIVGLPRSGTTLTEQIVSAHPLVEPGGELTELGSAMSALDWSTSEDFHAKADEIRAEYREVLRDHAKGAPFVTDKMPLNFRWIGAIRALFPEAKIIHLQRDPRAVIWSIYRLNFSSDGNAYAHSLDDLVAYRALHQDLMAHWKSLFGETIYDLSYAQLVENPEAEIRALLDYLELPFDEACLRPQDNKRIARTASRDQVSKPIYKGSSQAWEKYAPYLEAAFAKLD